METMSHFYYRTVKQIRRTLTGVMLLLLVFQYSVSALEIHSPNALLINRNENTVLYEKESEEVIPIASLTKLMTALVAKDHITDMNETVTITWEHVAGLAEANASVAGFYVGERVTYRDLLYGLLLPSGADAAQALAYLSAGSVEAFVEMMNARAQEMGLTHTHFANTTGLDHPDNYSTLREVAMILEAVFADAELREIICSNSYEISDGTLTLLSTKERVLRRYGLEMDYVLGGKTGSTIAAGICYGSIAEKDGVGYLCIVAGSSYYSDAPYQFLDSKTLYEYFMDNYSYQAILSEGDALITLPTLYCKNKEVAFTSDVTIERYLKNGFDKNEVQLIYHGEKVITHKMEAGKTLGKIEVVLDGEVTEVLPVVLMEQQEFDLWDYLSHHKKEVAAGGILILIPVLLIIKRKIGRR